MSFRPRPGSAGPKKSPSKIGGIGKTPASRARRTPPRPDSATPERDFKPLEQYLADAAPEMTGERLIFQSAGGGQAAAEAARQQPQARVTCNFFDVFMSEAARSRHEALPNLEFTCLPDLSAGPADVVALPLAAGAENELARDVMQQAVQRLKPDGRLFVSTDNRHDHWVHEHLKSLFGKVTNRPQKKGRLYIASQPLPLKKEKSYEDWFAFRDQERLIHCLSRPGVFSHRRLDLGARALIESLTVPDGPHAGEVIQPGMRVLDLGSGCGAVGFAASFRAENVSVHAIDASARAIQCTQLGAEKNGITRLTTQLDASGRIDEPKSFDLVLANPPYFSSYRIAEIFVEATHAALKRGGRTHFVTKSADWYLDRFPQVFSDVSVRELRGYFVIKATRD